MLRVRYVGGDRAKGGVTEFFQRRMGNREEYNRSKGAAIFI